MVAAFPNLRTQTPTEFAEILADTLQDFPPAIVEDCARRLPRETEFLSIKAVSDWCESERAWHRKIAETTLIIPRKPERPELPDNPERAAAVQQLITGATRKIP